MLNYQGLDEVGAIVAELDLAEGASDASYDPDDEDLMIGSDLDDDDEEDESEDETGQAKRPGISTVYKEKMEELEKSLGLKDMKNLGPDPDLPSDLKKELDRPSAAEAARKAALTRQKEVSKTSLKKTETAEWEPTKQKLKKKSVAFADSLDIAKADHASQKQNLPSHPQTKPEVNPLSESVVERSEATEDNSPPPPAPPSSSAPKKVSRFKKDKQAATQGPKEPKPRPLIAPQVLERPNINDPTLNQPPDPDTIDDEFHRRQLALEYHRLKNRRIHNQGGYVRHQDEDGDEDDFDDVMQDYGIVDPETGNVRKVSRFKAARVRG
jgi:unconventional prefoldin RPB5 interactor 1